MRIISRAFLALVLCALFPPVALAASTSTWCQTGVATLPQSSLGVNSKLRSKIQIRAVLDPVSWITTCPVPLLSAKTAESNCKNSSILYDPHAAHDSAGFQENQMVILRDPNTNVYTLVVDDPSGKEIARGNLLDSVPSSGGRWTLAPVESSTHVLFIYFLDSYDGINPMPKVYYAEDFDSKDEKCTASEPTVPGNVIDCAPAGPEACIKGKGGPTDLFAFLRGAVNAQEEGVGVGTEKRP